ncbi:metallophosphoesterase [Mariniflexile gromovii]|uniref:Metallophosphoesterase n=1 Tax=Mariniflexile gromovii TaxID=362523 RepID=A0ABS4BUN5_9FLAO|nr:metallophosphoesterase [Mariniflexile gromovii]MBP0904290.1 metallophosphoesterase [Mariniflexile gromovii]
MTFKLSIIFVFISLFFEACATYKPQYSDQDILKIFPENKTIEHSFYFIGDAGNSPLYTESEALQYFKSEINNASKQSTVVFLGDNIYPKGLPKKEDEGRDFAEHQLNIQTAAVKNFKGETIFIPGNHDWFSDGLKGLKRQQDFVEDKLGKNTFLPKKGCPIDRVEISDDIVLIVVDSEWYLTNWDNHPTMNDDCDIKTRDKFLEELEGEIKRARGKTTLIAIHHPMFSNGSHGGQYSLASHMLPFPVLGTLKNVIRKTGGLLTVDIQNKRYKEFRKRIITMSQENDKVIFVSGHDHNLQYIVQDNLPQIISGSGSKLSPTRNVGGGKFSYASPGFARLDVFEDGSSYVRFYSTTDKKSIFGTAVLTEDEMYNVSNQYHAPFSKEIIANIYSEKETNKGKLYKLFLGERFRKYYSTKIKAPTVNLDTLFGGVIPIRMGGGHQSKSLRLVDQKGREYVMRALRKSAVQYLQAVAFKDQYAEGQFNDTYTEGLLMDIFTGAYPYTPFTIGTLSDAIGVYHTNTTLYYVPKQKALGNFNNEFGDELYMIEERTDSGHGNKASFGFSNELISTNDLLNKLTEDEDFVLDEPAYIRARLFDMLIGDWDRHEDQWRWAEFKGNGKTLYRPVPRDRDQAFSSMADGILLSFATKAVPALRLMQSYDEELRSPKWFNLEPYPLDMALINQSDSSIWNQEVDYIIKNLTNEVIDKAFLNIPNEVNDETIALIKENLKGRLKNLRKISETYYNHINKYAVIKGTNKDDWFEIERLPNGETKVMVFRIKDGEKVNVFHERVYNSKDTKEIWIYGLDDDDVFKISGEGDKPIKIRLIGGQNKDTYNIENGNKIKIYDYKSKNNEFVNLKGDIKLTDDYETNVYDYKKLKNSSNQFLPTIGANPDDGFKIGVSNTYKTYGFERNPFTSQHIFKGAYYFATQGLELGYMGEFANVVGKMNLSVDINFTSPNYAMNFFGYGNETSNPEADDKDGLDVGMDYNRVKISLFKVSPALVWRGQMGASFKVGISYETNEVEDTQGRFINLFIGDNVDVNNSFVGGEVMYSYENYDNKAFPTLGMTTSLKVGYKLNVDNSNNFMYIIPQLGFDYKLVPNGQLVLASNLLGHINFGDGYEFYQAANIGANNGLRGYRNERFIGKNAFVQSTDVRVNLRKVSTRLFPLDVGVYGGFDYGRVWLDDDNSRVWNTSVGGGIFANIANMMTFNLSSFHGDDGLRLAFKMGFGFLFFFDKYKKSI